MKPQIRRKLCIWCLVPFTRTAHVPNLNTQPWRRARAWGLSPGSSQHTGVQPSGLWTPEVSSPPSSPPPPPPSPVTTRGTSRGRSSLTAAEGLPPVTSTSCFPSSPHVLLPQALQPGLFPFHK